MKPVLVSGIQPSGKLHIGNYLGALKNFVELQNSGKYECYFFIADYHSMTEEYTPSEKSEQVLALAEDFLAAGLDPDKSTLFLQSSIPAHTDLAWILNTITPFGELRRMTQFKEKADIAQENTNVGLFDYPVLMAADILLYDAKFVPVGDDQVQHLEFTRTLARKFNSRFPARNAAHSAAGGGKTFIEPQPLLTNIPRLMSLDDPTKKMSKSRPAGCLFLDDTPEEIEKKIQTAVTDSGKEIRADVEGKPAITNLLMLFSAVSGMEGKDLEKKYANAGYGEFKKDLAEAVVKFLAPFQKRKSELSKQKKTVIEAIERGNLAADVIASKKLIEIKKKIGLILY